MLELISFLLMTVVISLSGVMAPGPMSAAALASGVRARHAGVRLAVGHGIVEFPLMLLIAFGNSTRLKSDGAQVGMALVGGAFLVFLGIQLFRSRRATIDSNKMGGGVKPVWTGIVLTGANPYFLLWWATVGLTLTSEALEFGYLAFGLFAVLHWCCDLVWLEVLSWASFKGSKLMGSSSQLYINTICAAVMFIFGAMFILKGMDDLRGG